MKKLLKTTLAIMLIACFAIMSTACKIDQDWMDVEEKLLSKRYTVECVTDVDDIKQIAEDGESEVKAEDIECIMIAIKGTKFIAIVFCYYEDTAEILYDEAVDEKVDREIARELRIKSDDIEYGVDGRVVYVGLKDAVKDVK